MKQNAAVVIGIVGTLIFLTPLLVEGLNCFNCIAIYQDECEDIAVLECENDEICARFK